MAIVALTALAVFAGCTDTSELENPNTAKKSPKAPTTADAGSLEPVANIPAAPATPTPPVGTCTGQLSGAMQVPEWRPPHAKQAGACTAQEAATLATCTLAKQPCTGVSPGCQQCAVSNVGTSATYGALVIDPTGAAGPQINIEGCAATLLGDTTATGCGPKLQAQYHCELLTCGGCDAAQAAQCATKAEQGSCATYMQAASQCAPAANQCIASGTTTQAVAVALIQLFCM